MNFRGIKTDEINKVLTTSVSDISDIEANLPLLNERQIDYQTYLQTMN